MLRIFGMLFVENVKRNEHIKQKVSPSFLALNKAKYVLRTENEYNTRHCTSMKLQAPPIRTVVILQCITKKLQQIWNLLSTKLYTNIAHQTLIRVFGFSSRF